MIQKNLGENGFSLLTVLVGMVLVSIMATGMMAMAKTMGGLSSRAAASADWADLRFSLRSVLESNSFCTSLLAAAGPLTVGTPSPINLALLPIGENYGKLVLEEVSLKPITLVPGEEALVEMTVKAGMPSGMKVGRKLLISAQLDNANRVDGCASDSGEGGASAVFCSNSSTSAVCLAARQNYGAGDGDARAINCRRNTAIAPYNTSAMDGVVGLHLQFTAGKWKYFNIDGIAEDCVDGTVLVVASGEPV